MVEKRRSFRIAYFLCGLFDCVGTGGDKLVCGVVLVGGNQQSAAEAGAGFADGAAERVFIRTRPARRGEARRAFDRF